MNLEQAQEALAGLAATVEPTAGRIWRDGEDVWIDNPGAKGALTAGMMQDLARVVAELRFDPGALVILRGTPGAFCSGGHLRQVKVSLIAADRGLQMAHAMTVVLDALSALSQVVVAAVDGPALGGGAEILTAADHRVFGGLGQVGFVHARLGVAPGWGGAARLQRIVGRRVALRCLSTAKVLSREEAYAVGFADHLGTPIEGAVEAFVKPIRQVSPAAVRACKEQLVASTPLARDGREAEIFAGVWGSDEHRQRLAVALR